MIWMDDSGITCSILSHVDTCCSIRPRCRRASARHLRLALEPDNRRQFLRLLQRPDDAIRSLVISTKLLGTREWFVVHHTNCGMETFTDQVMGDLLAKSLDTAQLGEAGWRDVGKGPGSIDGKFIKWHTISDLAGSVVDDVMRIRNHPLVPKNIPIYGYIYDVKNGRLVEVNEATKAGKAAT